MDVTELMPGLIVKVKTFGTLREAEVVIAREVDVVVRWTSNRKRAVVDRAAIQTERPKQATKPIERTIHDEDTQNMSESAGIVRRALSARPKPKTARSAVYMDFVRSKTCCSCGAHSPSDPHHYGPGGMGLKTDDFRVVPLCRKCHDHFHDHRRLPGMDVVATRVFLLAKQVDLLVEYLSRRGNVETRSEEE